MGIQLESLSVLGDAGYKGEARKALNVVLLFPEYSGRYFGSTRDNPNLSVTSLLERSKPFAAFDPVCYRRHGVQSIDVML
jgi:hypothetical protein